MTGCTTIDLRAAGPERIVLMRPSTTSTPPRLRRLAKSFWLCLALTCGTAPLASAKPDDTASWPQGVTYEIFVRAFADGRGDGIGDFRGLTAQLDYLADLGVQALWLMPIHPSPSYHKYDVTDYRAIHPDYGTMEDFEEFLAAAHQRGLRVIIDFVVNHSARDHPWFEAAVAGGPGSEFFDYYVWRPRSEVASLTVERTGPDTDNVRRWNETPGVADHYYYAYFTGGMPDLNFDNPEVRREIYDIGRFWLEKGVDGFRLDAAKHIFPEDRVEDTVAFWQEFRSEMEKVNPNVLLVGEVWTDGEEAKLYLPGLRSLFNFEMAGAILEAVESGRGADLAGRHARLREQYTEVTADFLDATFLSNHDQNRVMSVLGDEDRARVAASLLLTMPGAPYLYYGEEIGMLGRKPDFFIREPMLWQPQPDPARPRPRRVRHSTDDTVRPVSVQREDPESLWHHYRALIQLRHATPALHSGDLEPWTSLDDRLTGFVRRHPSGDALVLHNLSRHAVTVAVPTEFAGFRTILWTSTEGPELSGDEVVMPALSSLVLSAGPDE